MVVVAEVAVVCQKKKRNIEETTGQWEETLVSKGVCVERAVRERERERKEKTRKSSQKIKQGKDAPLSLYVSVEEIDSFPSIVPIFVIPFPRKPCCFE